MEPPPPIRIEPEARAYIARNGGHATLRDSRRHGCCGGTAFVPVVELGRPADEERHRVMPLEGVVLHVERTLQLARDPLIIGIDGLWKWQRLRVDGAALRM